MFQVFRRLSAGCVPDWRLPRRFVQLRMNEISSWPCGPIDGSAGFYPRVFLLSSRHPLLAERFIFGAEGIIAD
jgi:hypothetical protein